MTQRAPWPSTTGPSTFVNSKAFRAGKSGKTASAIASEVSDQRRSQGNGPKLVIVGRAERLRQQVLAARWGHPYLKPGSPTR